MPITAAGSDPHHVPSVMKSTFWNGDNVSTTLTEAFADDSMPDKGKLPCIIESPVICVNDAEMPICNSEEANPCKCTNNGLENVVCYAAGGFGQKVESNVSATISTDHDDRVTGNNAALIMENIPYYPSKHHAPKPCETPTLTTDNCASIRGDSPLIQECYAIDSVAGNSMKSGNPHSGFHKEDIAKTLDTTSPDPTKNQGGNVIVENVLCNVFTKTARPKFKGDCETYADTGVAPTINCFDQGDKRANELVCESVAIAENIIGRQVQNGGNGTGVQEELAYTQNASGVMGVANHATVRRLLPIETERLMGFPDNWTKIPWKGKPAEECPDSPRYKACGNSMCVNVMRWIGMRIELTERKANRTKNKDKKK